MIRLVRGGCGSRIRRSSRRACDLIVDPSSRARHVHECAGDRRQHSISFWPMPVKDASTVSEDIRRDRMLSEQAAADRLRRMRAAVTPVHRERRRFSRRILAWPLPRPGAMSSVKPRWRVAIVDDHERSRAALRAAIWAAKGEVAGEALRGQDALELAERVKPTVAVFAAGLPDGDSATTAIEVIARGICPVVLFTSHTDDAVVDRARAAGVMAFLLKPRRPAELAPALDLAIARWQEAQTLRARLEERKIIERAKGTMMQRHGLTEDEAFKRLRRTAMDTRRPMVEIARAVLVSESVANQLPSK